MIDTSRLLPTLQLTGLAHKNQPLYQLLNQLIGIETKIATIINATGGIGPVGPVGADGKQGIPGNLLALEEDIINFPIIIPTFWQSFNGGIYYNNGSVGIGNLLPTTTLDVMGIVQSSIQYLSADGSNAIPAYSFTNSSNSGFRWQTNEIAFVINGIRWASVKTTGFQIAVNNNCLLVDGGAVNLLGIGGDSALFPGIKRNGTTLEIKLANDSAFTEIKVDSINVNVAARTARLHLPAGTATASTAPIKLTSGTLLTIPEAGTIEFDGTDFFLTA